MKSGKPIIGSSLLAVGAVCCANGATLNLKTGLTDIPTQWESPSSYTENSKPVAGDIVVVPNNTTAYVDDDTVAFVGSLKRVQTTGSNNSMVVFDISTNATVGCAVHANNYNLWQGKLVKRGNGDLTLNSNGDFSSGKNDYYSDITVKNGGLRIGANADLVSHNFKVITVEDGGTFYLGTNQLTLVGLAGSGAVTNENARRTELYIGSEALKSRSEPQVFSGTIGGNIRFHSRFHTYLTGEGSTFSMFSQEAQTGQDRKTGGVTGVKKFGMGGGASSIGSASTLGIAGRAGRLLYLGEGETTDKIFDIVADGAPFVIDGGATGGITFSGYWKLSTDGKKNRDIILDGDNVKPCVFAGKWSNIAVNNVTYNAHFTKTGTGTWRFANHPERNMTGAFAVEAGTLEFESMAHRGEMCSLGLATALYSRALVAPADATPVDYAYLLGGTNETGAATVGTMDYVGVSNFYASTRPMHIYTRGRLASDGTGSVKWNGITAAGDIGSKELILSGSNTLDNTVWNIADGEGRPFSVTKEGTGCWTISGDLSFSGALKVNAGTLTVKPNAPNGTPYSYYRFTVKETAYNCNRYPTVQASSYATSDKHVQMEEFALFDADGVRQNVTAFPYSYTNVMFNALKPGQAAYDGDATFTHQGTRYLHRLFDNRDNNNGQIGWGGWDVSLSKHPSIGDPWSWVPIVMCLTNGTPVITSYDMVNYIGVGATDNPGRAVTAYSIDGSADGVNWEPVVEDLAAEVPSANRHWYKTGDAFSELSTAKKTRFSFGRNGTVTNALPVLNNVSEIAVANGGVLRATSPITLPADVQLTVDAASGGNIDGFVFPAKGVLCVVGGGTRYEGTLPITFGNVSGLDNLKNWQLDLGSSSASRVIVVDGGCIRIVKRGLVVNFR